MSFAPITVVQRKRPDYVPQAALGAMTIRILVVGAVTLGSLTYGPWPAWQLSVWMIVFYLSMLAVETPLTIRLLNAREGASSGCSRSSAK